MSTADHVVYDGSIDPECDCEQGNDQCACFDECRTCQAVLNELGRCWYCDRSWIWQSVP